MKRMKIYKHHYDYKLFDTNIQDYVEYIVRINRSKIENAKNIVSDFLSFCYSLNDQKINYKMMYDLLYDNEYSLSDIKQYYNQLNDILKEHNRLMDNENYVQHYIDKKLLERNIKDKKSFDNMIKLVDMFGATTIENDNKKYVLTNAQVKERKTKK